MNELLPKKNKHIWLMFDLSNGHRGSSRYVWWFETRKDAFAHREWQMSQKHGADLSQPVKFVRK